MVPFSYERPATLSEAIALLDEHGDDASLLAGGTDLVVELRNRSRNPRVLIDLKHVAELRPGISERGGWLTIAAATAMTDVQENALVGMWFPALADASSSRISSSVRGRPCCSAESSSPRSSCRSPPSAALPPSTASRAGEAWTWRP